MVLLQSGSNTSSGGGGIQMLVSIETHITCDFPGGGGGGVQTPYLSPLWICTWGSPDATVCLQMVYQI